jgi:hypothetical protein
MENAAAQKIKFYAMAHASIPIPAITIAELKAHVHPKMPKMKTIADKTAAICGAIIKNASVQIRISCAITNASIL